MNSTALIQHTFVPRNPAQCIPAPRSLTQHGLIQRNLEVVLQRTPDLTARFYGALYQRHPEATMLFGRRSAETQARLLLDAVMSLVHQVQELPWLDVTLRALGRKHRAYGVTEEMYPLVASALMDTLRDASGERWDERTANAWSGALTFVATRMMAGARERELTFG